MSRDKGDVVVPITLSTSLSTAMGICPLTFWRARTSYCFNY